MSALGQGWGWNRVCISQYTYVINTIAGLPDGAAFAASHFGETKPIPRNRLDFQVAQADSHVASRFSLGPVAQ